MRQKKFSLKARWKNLAGIILLFVAMVTIIEAAPLTEASAVETEMTIDKNLVLRWGTTSKGNPYAGVHFRTTNWTFFVSGYVENEKTGETEYTTVKISQVPLSEMKVVSGTDYSMSYTWDLNDTSSKHARDFKTAIKNVVGDVVITANPTLEFYYMDSSGNTTKTYESVSDLDSANKCAAKYFSRSGYFNTYFDKKVTIKAVCLTVKKGKSDEGINMKTVTVDKKSAELASSNATEAVWYGKDDKETPEITVKINDGYVFKTATSTKGAGVASKDTNAKGTKATVDTKTLTKNTTIKLVSEPVQVKIVYYLDENGDGEYETKAGYYTYTYGSISGSTAQLGYGIDSSVELNGYTRWYTDEEESGEGYAFNWLINDELIWELYGTRDGEVQHRVCLYASKEAVDPTDSDYKIVYDGNGATSGSMADQYATYGTNTMLKVNAYTKTGYHTDKDDAWVSEKNGVTYAEAQSVSDATLDFDDEDKTVVTLDANWKPNECTIVYNGNGATSGTVKKQTITYDDWTTTLQENKFSKTGTSFDSKLSWNTKPDGSGTTFTPGTKVTKSVWKKLFGSYDANGVKITLYAVWGDTSASDTERETWELASLTSGQLTYVNPLDNDTDGPYAYTWTGSLSLLQCMFGTKYSTATTEYVTYDTGFQTTTEQQMFMITAGSTIYKGDTDEDWYKFEGWSIDEYAQYGDSDSIILAAGQTMSGEDLGAYAMAYKYPIKYNKEWDTMTLDEMMESGGVPEPTSTSLPSKSNLSGRASVISEAAKAWKTYKSLLESEIEASTTEYSDAADSYDDAKAAYEEAVDAYEAAEAAYNSAVSYRDSVKSQKPAKDSADYSSWYTSYSDAQSNVTSTKSAMNKAKTAMNKAKTAMDEAEEGMDTWEGSVDSYTDIYNSLIKQINNTISDTKLYAVWDKFPVFEDMDEIAINENAVYLYRMAHGTLPL